MHVMFHHQRSRFALLVVLSLTLMTTGCRSTRNGLSGLPGMRWLAAEEVPNWGSDAEEPGLPPPSREATPQLTTTTNTSRDQESYPDTGYPSPYNDDVGGSSSDSYPTGHYDDSNSLSVSDGVDAATVGNTQQGFYGDEYGDDRRGLADDDSSSTDSYDRYEDSYADQDYSSDASDADPQFEQMGDGAYDQAEVDPYERDAQGDLSTPEDSGGLRDGYEKFSRGIRDGAEAIAGGAERVGDRVQDFAREQGENIRSTVRDGYDRMNLPPNDLDQTTTDGYDADDSLPMDSGDPNAVEADSYDDGYSDYPAETSEDAYDDYPQENYDDYSTDSYDSTNDPAGSSPYQDPGASLNPPGDYDQPNEGPGVDSTPRRSVQPWRPGSTGTFRSSGIDAGSRSYRDTSAVAPASFPGQATDALQPQAGPDDYPAHGWESHTEASSQRLSPTYR